MHIGLDQQIEGVLFYKAAPLKKAALRELFGVDEATLETALFELQSRLQQGATRLIMDDTTVEIRTAPFLDELIESIRKDEMRRDIGKAGAETLAIIVYKGMATRADIDRIRGVNSSYILRNLMVRGLVEKTEDKQARYRASTALLAHLGITHMTELPAFTEIMSELETYERSFTETPS